MKVKTLALNLANTGLANTAILVVVVVVAAAAALLLLWPHKGDLNDSTSPQQPVVLPKASDTQGAGALANQSNREVSTSPQATGSTLEGIGAVARVPSPDINPWSSLPVDISPALEEELTKSKQSIDDFRHWQWTLQQLSNSQADMPSFGLISTGKEKAIAALTELVNSKLSRECTEAESAMVAQTIDEHLTRIISLAGSISPAPMPPDAAGLYAAKATHEEERLAAWEAVDQEARAILLQLDRNLVGILGSPLEGTKFFDGDSVPW